MTIRIAAPARKHLALLVAIVVMMVIQPLAGHTSVRAGMVFDAVFDYPSFTTLMTLGYGDITPIGAPAYSLTWLEVMLGQFYMAVVVAQLVGIKLAQALRGDGPEAK